MVSSSALRVLACAALVTATAGRAEAQNFRHCKRAVVAGPTANLPPVMTPCAATAPPAPPPVTVLVYNPGQCTQQPSMNECLMGKSAVTGAAWLKTSAIRACTFIRWVPRPVGFGKTWRWQSVPIRVAGVQLVSTYTPTGQLAKGDIDDCNERAVFIWFEPTGPKQAPKPPPPEK